MEDILQRNRFKKECEILVERLIILQSQVDSYKDLTEEIEQAEIALRRLKEQSSDMFMQIDKQNTELSSLGVNFLNVEGEHKKLLKQIEKNKKKIVEQTQISKKQEQKHLKRLEDIKKHIEKQKHQKIFIDRETEFKQENYELFINTINNKKGELFKKVEDNEIRLKEQEEKERELQNNLNSLKKEYTELDKEYAKLLEAYIIKQ